MSSRFDFLPRCLARCRCTTCSSTWGQCSLRNSARRFPVRAANCAMLTSTTLLGPCCSAQATKASNSSISTRRSRDSSGLRRTSLQGLRSMSPSSTAKLNRLDSRATSRLATTGALARCTRKYRATSLGLVAATMPRANTFSSSFQLSRYWSFVLSASRLNSGRSW
ncbi:hypothetical protein D3C71_1504510 [compost metagenome]